MKETLANRINSLGARVNTLNSTIVKTKQWCENAIAFLFEQERGCGVNQIKRIVKSDRVMDAVVFIGSSMAAMHLGHMFGLI